MKIIIPYLSCKRAQEYGSWNYTVKPTTIQEEKVNKGEVKNDFEDTINRKSTPEKGMDKINPIKNDSEI